MDMMTSSFMHDIDNILSADASNSIVLITSTVEPRCKEVGYNKTLL